MRWRLLFTLLEYTGTTSASPRSSSHRRRHLTRARGTPAGRVHLTLHCHCRCRPGARLAQGSLEAGPALRGGPLPSPQRHAPSQPLGYPLHCGWLSPQVPNPESARLKIAGHEDTAALPLTSTRLPLPAPKPLGWHRGFRPSGSVLSQAPPWHTSLKFTVFKDCFAFHGLQAL